MGEPLLDDGIRRITLWYDERMSTTTIGIDPMLNRQRAEKIHMLSQPPSTAETTISAAETRLDALIRIDPDDRLSFLMSKEWGFNTDHVRQVNRVVGEFLDTISKREIRRIAAQTLAAENPPQAIVDQWFTEEQRNRLRQFLDVTEVPDDLIVGCYAWLEAYRVAEAACLLHRHRSRPRPDFDSLVRTPEEREEDLRWANAV